MHEGEDKQFQSVAISGHEFQSVAISGNQFQSVAISGNQRHSVGGRTMVRMSESPQKNERPK